MSKPNREEIVRHIKTCIHHSKGGVPLSSISRDYHMLIGDPLPYKGLGYSKLEDFIRSIPDFKLISGPKGELVIQAVSGHEKNRHMNRLVAMQRNDNNTRFVPRSLPSGKQNTNEGFRKPWIRHGPGSSTSSAGSNKTLRTPSLLRNMSQPSVSTPGRVSSSLHRSQSSPSSHKELTPEAISKIPPLLSVDTSAVAPPVRTYPNISLDRRKDRNRGSSRRPINNNNDEVIYSPVVCPASNTRKPTLPTAEIKATEHIAVLKKYVKEHQLGNIDFKTIEMVNGSSKQYISSISIGNDFKVSTYPNGGNNTQEAMELAAKLAYKTLLDKLSSPSPNLPATQNLCEAFKRILKIIENHPTGVWASKIPNEYTSLYGEKLPEDWLKQTMELPQVDPTIISDKQIILALSATTFQKQQTTETGSSETTEVRSSAEDSQDFNNSSNGKPKETENKWKVSDSKELHPPPLQLPLEENWDVYVTNATSTTAVWFRLVGEDYSSSYENMATEMELYYLEHRDGITEAQEGNYYALALDDCMHRVQVATIEEGQVVHCLLLDHGQIERAQMSELRPLDVRFLRLPFQAVQCELQGLEQFRDVEVEAVQALLLDTVIGKTFVAQTVNKQVLGMAHAVGSPPVNLRLFDTSTDEDVDINQQLWMAITTTVLQPRLPQEGNVVEVMVSHITPEAQIYVQLQGVVLACIQDRIAALQPDTLPQNSVTKPIKGKIYLAPFANTCWYRSVVVAVTEDKVQVMFVDFGSNAKVNLSQLLDLEDLLPELTQIPFQAVLCRLHHILPCPGARVNEKTIARLITLLPTDKLQLLKVVGAASPTSPASVELFRRLEPDNLLVSLNNTLALDTSCFDMPDGKNEKECKVKLSQPSLSGACQDNSPRALSQPKVPDIGGYIDVNVTLAASPGNFVVQPWENGPELEQLMLALQSLYGAPDGPQLTPISIEEVQEGGIYTGLHTDGKWYRIQVNNILKGDFLTVFFVDFGDHTMMTVDKLRPLAAKFSRLPCQAIKAKLSGIRPKHSDWSVEDCVRFQELVCNHQFVSVVEETGPDLINPSDTVLGLRLIDTSNDQYDIDIGELLVKEQRAILE